MVPLWFHHPCFICFFHVFPGALAQVPGCGVGSWSLLLAPLAGRSLGAVPAAALVASVLLLGQERWKELRQKAGAGHVGTHLLDQKRRTKGARCQKNHWLMIGWSRFLFRKIGVHQRTLGFRGGPIAIFHCSGLAVASAHQGHSGPELYIIYKCN